MQKDKNYKLKIINYVNHACLQMAKGQANIKIKTKYNSQAQGGYFGVKRIGMSVGNPRKLP